MTSEARDAIYRDGITALPGAFGVAWADAMRADIEAAFAEAVDRPGGDRDGGVAAQVEDVGLGDGRERADGAAGDGRGRRAFGGEGGDRGSGGHLQGGGARPGRRREA